MRNRGFTLLEVIVASTVLLLMVGMTSFGVIYYLRSFRHYERQGTELRRASKTLEAICRPLRAAGELKPPLPASLKRSSLSYQDDQNRPATLALVNGEVILTSGDQQTRLGKANDVEFIKRRRLLDVKVFLDGQAPLQTSLVLRQP